VTIFRKPPTRSLIKDCTPNDFRYLAHGCPSDCATLTRLFTIVNGPEGSSTTELVANIGVELCECVCSASHSRFDPNLRRCPDGRRTKTCRPCQEVTFALPSTYITVPVQRATGRRNFSPELVIIPYIRWFGGFDHTNLPVATSSMDDETQRRPGNVANVWRHRDVELNHARRGGWSHVRHLPLGPRATARNTEVASHHRQLRALLCSCWKEDRMIG
jgi:hypothetical protein